MNLEIKYVLDKMKASNYFGAWHHQLLSESTPNEWESILDNSDNKSLYDTLAQKLYVNGVPYVIVSEYIDEFFRYCKRDNDRHQIKNNIAQAYLEKKLIDDNQHIQEELNKKLSVTLESKQELINAHMKWMQHFIKTIIGIPQYFELDPTKCFVGRWLIEEDDNVPKSLGEQHRNLHSMAQSALRMYEQEDYAYFLLLYTDILSASFQIRDTIMHIYFSRRLTSIFQDPVSNKANYFQLRHDIEEDTKENAILMFNIKEFKKMNLLYGHDEGDKIIKTVAELVSNIDNVISTYRIYGDEFAIIFPKNSQEQVVQDFKVILFGYEFNVADELISLSFYGSVAQVSKDILEKCEYGLMVSKHNYGDIADVDMIDEALFLNYANEISFSQKLKLAFLDNRILTHFQPIMDLTTNTIQKYEVLMRIEAIDGTLLYPGDFLDVLKEMYLYPEVTKMIIKKSFDFFKDKPYSFSINLSYADVVNEDTKAFILELLKENKKAAPRCVFELLEYDAVLNIQEVVDFFADLHSYGVQIALDDFGVGYSNYDTVFKLDIDFIKIDGSLVESILTNEKSKVIVKSIVSVAKKMNAQVVAEYVSSQEIFDVISTLGIEFAQGYFIGKPSKNLNNVSFV